MAELDFGQTNPKFGSVFNGRSDAVTAGVRYDKRQQKKA